MDVLTNENFDQSVKDGVVLVDFFAEWCGPCHALAPVIEELSQKYADKSKFYQLDVDAAPQIAAKFQVMSIPTVIIFKNGQVAGTIIGAQPSSRYTDQLDKVLA